MMSNYLELQVRSQGGLPVLVELLQAPSGRICATAATALRNLSLEPETASELGKNALPQLVAAIPDLAVSSVSSRMSVQKTAPLLSLCTSLLNDNEEFIMCVYILPYYLLKFSSFIVLKTYAWAYAVAGRFCNLVVLIAVDISQTLPKRNIRR